MQHHLRTDLFKGGVYDPREAVETFCHGEEGHLEPLEGRAVTAQVKYWEPVRRDKPAWRCG